MDPAYHFSTYSNNPDNFSTRAFLSSSVRILGGLYANLFSRSPINDLFPVIPACGFKGTLDCIDEEYDDGRTFGCIGGDGMVNNGGYIAGVVRVSGFGGGTRW